MYLPNSPPIFGSFHSTLIALNNASHKFWNLSKTGQSVSDVSGLPKKTRLLVGVLLVLPAYLPSIVTFLSTSVLFHLAKETLSLFKT